MPFTKIDKILENAVENNVAADVVVMLADSHEVRYAKSVHTGDGADAGIDQVYWIASQTKAIVATAALQLVDQQLVQLDTPVAEVLPELKTPWVLDGFDGNDEPVLRAARGEITLRKLLNHTSGLAYDLFDSDMAKYTSMLNIPNIIECRNATLETPLVSDPGTEWVYGLGIDWAGKLIERVTGLSLGDYLEQNIFVPLGMSETSFGPRADQKGRVMPMRARGADGSLTPIPFELPAEPEFEMGGGGLYGTAADYMRFQQMILRSGRTESGDRFLSEESFAALSTNQIGDLSVTPLAPGLSNLTNTVEFMPETEKKWSLGFMINVSAAKTGRSPGSLAWAGLGNSYYWIDIQQQVAGILVTQTVPFGDPAILELFTAVENVAYDSWARSGSASVHP